MTFRTGWQWPTTPCTTTPGPDQVVTEAEDRNDSVLSFMRRFVKNIFVMHLMQRKSIGETLFVVKLFSF
jgi:hypothetical protein